MFWVFYQIVSNSKKSEGENYIYVNISENDKEVEISIKDTGIGINKEKHDIIFNLFEQVDKSYTRKSEGSGLGLYIVKHLISLQGGKIDLISEEGRGSNFIINLPLITNYDEQSAYDRICSKKIDLIERAEIEFSDI